MSKDRLEWIMLQNQQYFPLTLHYLPPHQYSYPVLSRVDPLGRIRYQQSVYVPWGGGRYVTVTFEPEIMRLSVDATVRSIIISGKWDGAYRVANEMKWVYRSVFGRAFPVSTKSVAIEIIGHVVPDLLASIIGVTTSNALIKLALQEMKTHTAVVDIGTKAAGDTNRWIWDGLAATAWWLGSTY